MNARAVVVVSAVFVVTAGCGTSRSGGSRVGEGGASNAGSGNAAGTTPALPNAGSGPGVVLPGDAGVTPTGCRNLQCAQQTCATGTTTLTGTVYAPNGTLPLYNALVYVPNAPVPPLPREVTCDRCGVIAGGEPIAATLSDAHGAFRLENVPAGTDIPLVIQVGKWRREVVVPEVRACETTALDDPELTRLPRNRSEGNLPRIALTTGSCDNLICLMPKLGIDASEWGIAGEDRAVTFYSGVVQSFDVGLDRYDAHLRQMTNASTLWGDRDELMKYDMAVLSCECEEALSNKSDAAFDAVTRYLNAGGRVFGTDFQYVWYKYSPDARLAGLFDVPGPDFSGNVAQSPVVLDASFPKGRALVDWFDFVSPAAQGGRVDSAQVFGNFRTVRAGAQVWGSSAVSETDGTLAPRFMTVNTPAGVPVADQCGRAVHLDAHIAAHELDALASYPADCTPELTQGEQVLAFFFFDVAACIQDDAVPPVPPPIVVR